MVLLGQQVLVGLVDSLELLVVQVVLEGLVCLVIVESEVSVEMTVQTDLLVQMVTRVSKDPLERSEKED